MITRESKNSLIITNLRNGAYDLLRDAHGYTSHCRGEMERSKMCGCICCERVFNVDEVGEWIDKGETPLCPYCGVDALIPDASGIELSRKLLHELNKKYF